VEGSVGGMIRVVVPLYLEGLRKGSHWALV